mmetsp:Transcript_41806/g.73499  ORF Transcript_41806/g.73499 Transcript_41806/m.73499 type:complete len:115 (-) Transcript_41806:49-393(-)
MWPFILGGIGVAALGARSALRAAQRSGVKMPEMPNLKMPTFSRETMSGFESPMSRKEASKILNVGQVSPSKDSIREAHRRLLVANHPDKGGSTYIASKINEAKDVMLGKKNTGS